MKNLLAVLVTMISMSSVFACPGGDLIQLVLQKGEGKKLLAVEYNKMTGARTYMSTEIRSIQAVMFGDESACTTASCEQLQILQGRRVQFQIEFQSGQVVNKTITSLTVNPNQGHAKVFQPGMMADTATTAEGAAAMIELDINGAEILSCSTKN